MKQLITTKILFYFNIFFLQILHFVVIFSAIYSENTHCNSSLYHYH